MKTIGQNIAACRKEKGITQETLAEICSVTPQAVSNGKTTFPITI